MKVNAKRILPGLVLGALATVLSAADAAEFEKLALMDSLDMAYWCDVETKEGTIKLLEDCLRPNANVILWRDKGGGSWMRYPSKEEPAPYTSEYVMDKRRNLPTWGSYWDLRLDNLDFDVFSLVFEECRRRNLGYGIHQTYEENHTSNNNIALWNLNHPEFWNCANGGVPFPGTVSLAFPEVMAHKLRFADEHIALKPQRIFLDVWRSGNFDLKYEYVKPNIEKWRKMYPGEELPKPTDERWIRLCSESTMKYLREYGRRCKAAGIQFVVGLPTSGQSGQGVSRKTCKGDVRDINHEFSWKAYGIDWHRLAEEGAVDGIWIMDVKYDEKDVWGSLKATLDYVVANRGKAKIYFGVNWYDIRHESIKTYAKNAGCSIGEATRKLMSIAKDAGCAGVVYECVDCHCYDKECCEELKKW